MAIISYSNPSTQKLVFLLAAIFLLLAIKENSAQTVSFNIPSFQPNERRLTFQGSAAITSDGNLRLPNNIASTWQTGRALYSSPVPIWNTITGNVASFSTNFEFLVRDYSSMDPADGLAFFLAPYGSKIPRNSRGGYLGVIDGSSSRIPNQVVFVEFDSFSNRWDPNFNHVGINANSIQSLRTMRWNRDSGWWVKVNINYYSSTRTLRVNVIDGRTGQVSTMSQMVDLRAVLPPTASIGFSGTHSGNREYRAIRSWSFTSTLTTSHATNNISTIASSTAAAT